MLDAAPPDDARVAARSFWAMALTVPCFVFLRLLDWWSAGAPPHMAWRFGLDLLAYAIAWLGFAVLSHAIAARTGHGKVWPRYIAVWNWCNLVENAMQSLAALPVLLGVPDWTGETLSLVATGWALWLEWYATRSALEVSGIQAAGLTGLDFTIAAFMLGLASSAI